MPDDRVLYSQPPFQRSTLLRIVADVFVIALKALSRLYAGLAGCLKLIYAFYCLSTIDDDYSSNNE